MPRRRTTLGALGILALVGACSAAPPEVQMTSDKPSWQGTPADVAAQAVVVDDPVAPRGTFTHWVVLDLPPGPCTLTGTYSR